MFTLADTLFSFRPRSACDRERDHVSPAGDERNGTGAPGRQLRAHPREVILHARVPGLDIPVKVDDNDYCTTQEESPVPSFADACLGVVTRPSRAEVS
jgi:hypothetical protein